MRLVRTLGVTLIVAFALLSADKTQPLNVKLGLWQMTDTSEHNGVSTLPSVPPELLAKMTPDQRARVEAKLKARAAQGPHIDTKRFCLTEERLNTASFTESDRSCRRTIVASTSKVTQFREECEENGVKRFAEGHFEALDPEAMKGSLKSKGEGNNALTVNTDITGRWLGADCGDTAADAYSKR
jgi:hypothetical protein